MGLAGAWVGEWVWIWVAEFVGLVVLILAWRRWGFRSARAQVLALALLEPRVSWSWSQAGVVVRAALRAWLALLLLHLRSDRRRCLSLVRTHNRRLPRCHFQRSWHHLTSLSNHLPLAFSLGSCCVECKPGGTRRTSSECESYTC